MQRNSTTAAPRRSQLFMALLLVAVLAACGGAGDTDDAAPSPADTSTDEAATDTATDEATDAETDDAPADDGADEELVTLDIAASLINSIPYMTILQVAVDEGWFEEEGLDVSIVEAGGGGDTVRVLTAGEVDLAISGPEAIYLASQQPASNIEIVGGWFQTNIIAWVGDEPDQDPQGAVLGVTGAGSTGETMAKAIQATNPELELEILVVGGLGDNFTAMQAGEIDGAYTADPFKTQQVVEEGAHVLIEARDYIDDVPMNLVAANSDFADENPEAIEAFWRVADRAFSFVREDTDAAVEAVSEYIDIPQEVLDQSIRETPEFEESWTINTRCDSFTSLSDELVAAGVIDEPIDWGATLNQEFLPPEARCDEF